MDTTVILNSCVFPPPPSSLIGTVRRKTGQHIRASRGACEMGYTRIGHNRSRLVAGATGL